MAEPAATLPIFSGEVLGLFAKLEATPVAQRGKASFRADDKKLAALPSLSAEWITDARASVTYCGPLYSLARADCERVRAVRLQLLQSLKEKSSRDPRQSLGADAG
jgi:hypothetical protein